MSEARDAIVKDIEDDVTIKVSNLIAEDFKKGIFPRRRFIRITGSVKTEQEREKIGSIADHHARDNYGVINEVVVKGS